MTQEFTQQQKYGPPNGKTGEMPLGLQVNSNWLNQGVYQIVCLYHNLSDVSKAWFKLHSPPRLVPEWLFTNTHTHTHTIKEIQVQWNFSHIMQLAYRWRSQDRKWYKGFLDLWNPKAAVHLMTTKKSRTTLQRADRVIILKRSSGKRNLKSGLVFSPYSLTLVYSVQCFLLFRETNNACSLLLHLTNEWINKCTSTI